MDPGDGGDIHGEFQRRLRAAEVGLAADPTLAALVARFGACTLAPAWGRSPFESLVRAVSHQQLQGKAAEAILGRFVALFAPLAFPEPAHVQAIDDATLRATGLSRSKIAAIRDIAAKADAGVVPGRDEADSLGDAELVRRLVTIRGVGAWTVEMMLIFSLGRLDVLPVDDYGVRKGMQMACGLDDLPDRRTMTTLAEPWRPWRSIASWYLWRLVEGAPRVARRRSAAGAAVPVSGRR